MSFTSSFSNDVSGRNEIANLIGTEDVAGMPVFDANGHRLGWIEEVMFDKFTGKATYAVVSAAGGSGSGKHPVPWPHLRYAQERGGYEIEIDAEAFGRAPALSGGSADWSDPEMRRKVLDFYKRPTAV
jgi:sporulation protein YlmC with PRC-barrel domain